MPAYFFLVFALACATGPADRAVLIDGNSLEGQLQHIDGSQVQWQLTGSTLVLDIADLESIEFEADGTTASTREARKRNAIRLIDGTQIHFDQIQLDGDRIRAIRGASEWLFSRQDVSTIRMAQLEEIDPDRAADFDQRWDERNDSDSTEDLLTIRRSDENADGEETIELADYEGIVQAIDDDNVHFQFGDDLVPVARDRVESIELYHPAGSQLDDASCQISLHDGSVILAGPIRGTADDLEVTTVCGATVRVSRTDIRRIDYAFGRIAYLDALEPTTVQWSPFIESRVIDQQLAALNSYRRNRSFGDDRLAVLDESIPYDHPQRVGGSSIVEFDRGLAIRSHSRLIFPVSGKYSRFVATAGIDPEVRPRGSVELIILGDGIELYRGMITGKDRTPVQIDLPIEGVARLTIEVAYGDELDIGDQLNLCRARVLK